MKNLKFIFNLVFILKLGFIFLFINKRFIFQPQINYYKNN